MRGETVCVHARVQTGTDDLNDAVWEDVELEVDNVLVAPGASQDVVSSMRPDGVQVRYTLYFPKTFDGRLEHCSIDVRGERLDVVGSPRRFDKVNCPTEWWMVVEVACTNG